MGKAWSVDMPANYGYIRRAEGMPGACGIRLCHLVGFHLCWSWRCLARGKSVVVAVHLRKQVGFLEID
ncbi:MAG: hypothetical protein HUJ24_05315 [Rhodobacteraceae bacterium]|nr:hypothetical protein [Paracoccaceae bacterium]